MNTLEAELERLFKIGWKMKIQLTGRNPKRYSVDLELDNGPKNTLQTRSAQNYPAVSDAIKDLLARPGEKSVNPALSLNVVQKILPLLAKCPVVISFSGEKIAITSPRFDAGKGITLEEALDDFRKKNKTGLDMTL